MAKSDISFWPLRCYQIENNVENVTVTHIFTAEWKSFSVFYYTGVGLQNELKRQKFSRSLRVRMNHKSVSGFCLFLNASCLYMFRVLR